MPRLLIEIGTEEIPAGYIEPALRAFSENLLSHLDEKRISHGSARVYGTPRRLALMVEDVAERQSPRTIEQTGPPEKVAFDENGAPTTAARKFAEKMGVPAGSLLVRETAKGRYVAARKTDPGRASKKILRESIPGIILSLPFPKTMRWADLSIEFARPIHSLLALLGNQVVSLSLGNIKSSRFTFGHRFLSPSKIKLSEPGEYLESLRKAWVAADIEERKKLMRQQMEEAVKSAGCRVLPDEELADTVANLVEYPATVLGSFSRQFLELPREVLITAMREHQRYFAVVDEKDKVMPYFLAVNNTLAKDMELVKRGHERVLKARLEDARFFFQSDLDVSPDDMAEGLRSVLFQAELGSVHDRVERIRSSSEKLAGRLGLDSGAAGLLDRAARLCKADLVSKVVNEFPKLQGVMGRIYASYAGEHEMVAKAVEEHYRPVYAGGALPETLTGSLLAVADKMDAICGCFLAGLVPTGASDPYALRRQGIGLLQIILENGFPFSIEFLADTGFSSFSSPDPGEARRQACSFLAGRLEYILESRGISKDAIAAVIAASEGETVPVTAQKASSLERLKAEPEFETLATGFKRVVNIIRKASPSDMDGSGVDPGAFEYEAEKELYDAYNIVKGEVRSCLDKSEIDSAFNSAAGLRKTVDRFFDDVLVMTEDSRLRKNRLALLNEISGLFSLLADFSKIST